MLLSRYVKLISSDGHEFIVKRDHALTSGTIKAMLSGIISIYLYPSIGWTGVYCEEGSCLYLWNY